ncbi:MAG: HAD family hydrolase [Candidatus Bathyarchaeia archaeon]
MFGRIEAVSFDCGGTLYFEVEEDYVVFHRILRKLGYDFELAKVEKALDDARLWWNHVKAVRGEIWNENSWLNLLRRMVSNLGIPDSLFIARQLRDCWLSEAEFRAYDDAVPTLSELKNAGFKLAAISNVSSLKNLKTYMRKAGIPNYFDVIIASAEVGYEKPSLEIFKIASRALNVPLPNILHVGDKYKEDYLGAHNAGLKALLIDRKGKHKNKQCPTISKLTEIISLVKQGKHKPSENSLYTFNKASS